MYIIAEIGINHNGSMRHAENLIEQAYEAKCNAVKFFAALLIFIK